MTFAAFWKRKVHATPAMGDDEQRVTITVASLRRELDQAYRAGKADAGELRKLADSLDAVGRPSGVDDILNAFGSMFR